MIEEKIDQIFVSGEFRQIQMTIRQVETTELGDKIERALKTFIFDPDDDISHCPKILRDIADVAWTDEIKEQWANEMRRYPSLKNFYEEDILIPDDYEANSMIARVYTVQREKVSLDEFEGYVSLGNNDIVYIEAPSAPFPPSEE